MENNRYKIVVLSDLKGTSNKILRSTVGLAKMINGDIELLFVKKATDIVNVDNQLSAMRTINSAHTVTDSKIRKLIAPISETYGVDIKYSFAFGNLKNEIGKYLAEHSPDVVVLGSRKAKPLNLLGDGVTEFVLNSFDGVIMIASQKQAIEPGKQFSLGVINELEHSFNMEFAQKLMAHVRKPVKLFKFIKNSAVSTKRSPINDNETREYVFEYNEGNVNNLSRYLWKNDIGLLSMERGTTDYGDNKNLNTSDHKNIMNKAGISLLISAR